MVSARFWHQNFFCFLQPGDDLFHFADQLVEAFQGRDIRLGPGHVHAGFFQDGQRIVAAAGLQELEVAALRLVVALELPCRSAPCEAMMPVLYWNT